MAAQLSRRDLSPRRRASIVLATLLLTVLQVAAASHLISHSASGDTGGCELCLNAAHGGDAVIASAAPQPVLNALVGRLIVVPDLPVFSRTPGVYRARGPPSFA